MISVEKMGKKARKQYYAAQRGSWNGVNPVTRRIPSGKAYNRRKEKDSLRSNSDYGLSFLMW